MTWSRRLIIVVISVSISYGIWFDYLDSLPGIGTLFGGNVKYQPWNILGHFIPGLFMLLIDPKKIELFIAAFLISSAVMDLPIWGVERIYAHHGFLWLQHGNTYSITAWTKFYYCPVCSYGVWSSTYPTAAMMFWSIVGRLVGAGFLIWYQTRIEKQVGHEFTLLTMRREINLHKEMKRNGFARIPW